MLRGGAAVAAAAAGALLPRLPPIAWGRLLGGALRQYAKRIEPVAVDERLLPLVRGEAAAGGRRTTRRRGTPPAMQPPRPPMGRL
jgi:uncharacterized membrane protein YccC